MAAVLSDPFYYLENFRQVLDWIAARHDDLLEDGERAFMADFAALPRAAQALLVRMVMRKGELFRRSRLQYAEIGDAGPALRVLAERGLIDPCPGLMLDELFTLLKKDELLPVFGEQRRGVRKSDLLEALRSDFPDPRPLADWWPDAPDAVCRLCDSARYDRLRLLFFGNLQQDWSEFVLADLGIVKYETVDLTTASRAFRQRTDVDDYLHLHACRERLENGEDVLGDVPSQPHDNPWLEERRARLLFRIGQQAEKCGDFTAALDIYARSAWPEARLRRVRVLEQDGQIEAAFALAEELQRASPREEDRQQLARSLPRLRRKLGLEKLPVIAVQTPERLDLVLRELELPVEFIVRDHFATADSPVFYVENGLVNSLFGLLCWPAVFAPLPGAFFHPFHYGPADLHSPDFRQRREAEFARCFAMLASGNHREAILSTWREKCGVQSPFVFWDLLDEHLLTLALDCIPAAHLGALFERLLSDIRTNRSGFPDLIRFWPAEKRYQMLEVKGPGDRLQDNQIRWLDYCGRHGIPVAVCHVQWQEES